MKNPLSRLRIVFMGTPEFAVVSLRKLAESGANIVGVITAPDKPGGRGMQLQQSAVKKFAFEKNYFLLQPEKLKDPDFQNTLRELKADIQVVVAFRMLPEAVWNMPPLGTINVHASLLPQYRGAAPINWAIINGESETGVTTFKMKHEIDTGDILLSSRLSIHENETAGELHNRMAEAGAELLIKTLNGIADGSIKEQPQTASVDIKHAPKIFSETCSINWDAPVDDIHNLVRGLSPYPCAFTMLNGKKLKVYFGKKIKQSGTTPGKVSTDHREWLRFDARDGCYEITDLQLEGKKRMPVTEFLKGYRFNQ